MDIATIQSTPFLAGAATTSIEQHLGRLQEVSQSAAEPFARNSIRLTVYNKARRLRSRSHVLTRNLKERYDKRQLLQNSRCISARPNFLPHKGINGNFWKLFSIILYYFSGARNCIFLIFAKCENMKCQIDLQNSLKWPMDHRRETCH